MSTTTTTTTVLASVRAQGRAYARRYWAFAAPAAPIVLLVILFPWAFTIFMSLHDWKVTGATPFVGAANYVKMLQDDRFLWALIRTIWFTAATVIVPMLLGVWAAVCFASKFRLR